MALTDWLWLVRLVIEILKLISQLPDEELQAIARIREISEPLVATRKPRTRKPKSPTEPAVT